MSCSASLDSLAGWPERVVTMQRNWIGRSVGTEIDFAIENRDEKITVFTTRPDTLYGATFMSLAPENPLALKLAEGTPQYPQVQSFIERILKQDKTVRSSDDLVKEGVFTGAYCINPVTRTPDARLCGEFCSHGIRHRRGHGRADP